MVQALAVISPVLSYEMNGWDWGWSFRLRLGSEDEKALAVTLLFRILVACKLRHEMGLGSCFFLGVVLPGAVVLGVVLRMGVEIFVGALFLGVVVLGVIVLGVLFLI
ncbi:hypothetical protein C2G38_2216951 [Gigaspora rosea]|uniref:Transmembrane protein n=1 Tax=Gigaspora rosea TaxID=44941 RepID=A0A397U9V6_9GLOM|nr:hypothetical protein C2G38_2216951 [Gigaspora rosea]